jgi:glycosyltransferase involved in cell wall biosynthesis
MAQVVRPMQLMAGAGFDVRLSALTVIGQFARAEPRRNWLSRRDEIRAERLPISFLPSLPTRLRSAAIDAAFFSWWLGRKGQAATRLVVHCRGTYATELALAARNRLPNVRVLSDCRGVDAPEMLMSAGFSCLEDAPDRIRHEYAGLQARQESALRRADAVLCVSRSMRTHIARESGPRYDNMSVVPCCTDVDAVASAAAERNGVRQRLGLADKLVVAYNGSLAPWQRLRESIALFAAISRLRSQAHFLAITTHPAAVRAALREMAVPSRAATVLSVAQREVAGSLAAADVGLLLRDESLVNRVASPVKFAEYLAAGVPVVLTDGIGDASELVQREQVGCVLDGLENSAENVVRVQAFVSSLRLGQPDLQQQCRRVAREQFSWAAHLPTLSATYRKLAERSSSP